MNQNKIIQSFWYGKKLLDTEILCINSFIKNNYEYHLYTYNDIDNAPKDTCIKDANAIIDIKKFKQCTIYTNNISSSWKYGSFSDMFRYRLLSINGGWWHDTDSCCINKFDIDDEYVFAEHYSSKGVSCLCNGIIKSPPNSEFFKICFDESYRIFNHYEGNVPWGKIGPKFLDKKIKDLKLNPKIYSPITFCPFEYWKVKEYLLSSNIKISEKTYCIHLYTSTWSDSEKHLSIDKNCKISELYKKYCEFSKIQVEQLTSR
jgi:hypothetical protein